MKIIFCNYHIANEGYFVYGVYNTNKSEAEKIKKELKFDMKAWEDTFEINVHAPLLFAQKLKNNLEDIGLVMVCKLQKNYSKKQQNLIL